ncbi:unnamed protein product [Phaeothamnion confervicola]
MSSWVSHLPEDVRYAHVEGHGLNTAELRCSPQLDGFFVQDLNAEAELDGKNGAYPLPVRYAEFDAALCTCGMPYLLHPERLALEAARIVRRGGPFIVSFTRDFYPEKVVAGWATRTPAERAALVEACLAAAGFEDIETVALDLPHRATGDSHVVVGGGGGGGGGGSGMMAVLGRSPGREPPPEEDRPPPSPQFEPSRLMGVLAATAAEDRWRARFDELVGEAEAIGIPRYGMPLVPTDACEDDIRAAMRHVQLVVTSYRCADI